MIPMRTPQALLLLLALLGLQNSCLGGLLYNGIIYAQVFVRCCWGQSCSLSACGLLLSKCLLLRYSLLLRELLGLLLCYLCRGDLIVLSSTRFFCLELL